MKSAMRNDFPDKSFAEFFAGIGLVREGLSAGGWHCTYANDIDPKKREMYEGHFGKSPHYHVADIWKTEDILAELASGVFLATASFPCVDLSLAGHWKGFNGEHSSTYFGFLEVLRRSEQNRPKLVMLENVHGFLTSRDGDDFRRAVTELAALGYWIDAIALDAKSFVPQSRPRVFVFGFHESLVSDVIVRQDADFKFVNPWRAAIERSGPLRPPALSRLIHKIILPTGWATLDLIPPSETPGRLADAIDVDESQEWWSESETVKHYLSMEAPSRSRVDLLVAAGVSTAGTAFRRTRGGKTRTEVRFDVAGCLRTPKGGSAKQIVVALVQGKLRMRWMSPVEYARLQGAANFNITVPTTQALHGFGDAVCVPAIAWIDANVLTPIYQSAAARHMAT